MFRRLLCSLAALALLMTAAAAAAQTTAVDYEEAGIRLHVAETLISQYGLEAGVEDYGTVLCLPITCMNPEYRDGVFAGMLEAVRAGDEESYAALAEDYYAHLNLLNVVFAMSGEQYEKTKQFGQMPFDETLLTALGEHNGYVYWLSTRDELGEEALAVQSEQEIAGWQACREALSSPEAFIEFIPVVRPETVEEGSVLPAFETQDLQGNTVTNAIFAQKDVTVINFWGTFCSPCISEMPELGAWMREMPENAQLIGVVTDAMLGDSRTAQTAAQILEKADAPFVSLLMDDALAELCSTLVGVPTTVLVDSEGRIIGEPILGAQVDKYRHALAQALGAQQ